MNLSRGTSRTFWTGVLGIACLLGLPGTARPAPGEEEAPPGVVVDGTGAAPGAPEGEFPAYSEPFPG